MKPGSKDTSRYEHPLLVPGFTLVEMLVVIAIVSLLIAILLPSVRNMHRRGQDVAAAVALRQTFTAMTLYTHDNNLGYPYWGVPGDPEGPYTLYGRDVFHYPADGHFERQSFTWANMVVPYMSGIPELQPTPFDNWPGDVRIDGGIFLNRFRITHAVFADPKLFSDEWPIQRWNAARHPLD
ncbi:MAG: type II secretion system protein [Phycisphaerales bacterium]